MAKGKSPKILRKGRIKKELSEWDVFWNDKKEFLAKPTSWHDAIPEVLHIAIALQRNEPKEILESLSKIRDEIKRLHGVVWKGNLSILFQLIRQNPFLIDVIKATIMNDSIKCLLITYNKMFNAKVPEGNLLAHRIVYRGYFDLKERRKDVSILCKYILCKFLNGDKTDPFGLFNAITRSEVLEPGTASSVTPNWIIISQEYGIVDNQYSEFIWEYNIKHLPFIIEPDSTVYKRETKNFKMNKMNSLKQKLGNHYLKFKEIDLLNYFNKYVAEVFMGFVSRMHYLSIKIIEQEERHEGEIAESTLRLLYETRLKFLWLNKIQDVQTIKQFREYKIGREKLFLDYLEKNGKEHPDFDSAFNRIKELFQQDMQAEGVDDYKLAIEKGDSFEKSIKEMADDLGEDEAMMYFIIYKRTSDIIHGNWRVIENYHLERSLNPAQDNLLRYRSSNNTYAGLLPSYLGLMLSTSALIKFIEFYDSFANENKQVYNSLKRFYTNLNKKYAKTFGHKSVNEF